MEFVQWLIVGIYIIGTCLFQALTLNKLLSYTQKPRAGQVIFRMIACFAWPPFLLGELLIELWGNP